MSDWHKKIFSIIKTHSYILYVFLFFFYITGFIVWNYHLSNYGFFEYNIFQTRFLSAGLVFLSPIIILLLILYLDESYPKKYCLFIFILLIFAWTLIFFDDIFNKWPQYLGGGRPFPTTIIGTPEQIKYLSNFGILAFENGDREPVQTYPVCLTYQNNDFIVFAGTTQTGLRILSLQKDYYVGLQKPSKDIAEIPCDILDKFR